MDGRLVHLQMVAKSLTGEELAREIVSVLSVQYSIGTSIGCFSHTIDRVGEHFVTPNLSEFIISWISLFSHSPKIRILWRDQTGRSLSKFGNV